MTGCLNWSWLRVLSIFFYLPQRGYSQPLLRYQDQATFEESRVLTRGTVDTLAPLKEENV